VKEESENLVAGEKVNASAIKGSSSLVRSGKFWALVAASFVVWKAIPGRRRKVSIPSNIIPRATNQTGEVQS
jgi:hypothetical protein